MRQENTTVDDLQKARLYMTECPKNGKISSDFLFPEFDKIIIILRDLWYVFKTAPAITAGKIKNAIRIASSLREDCLIYISNYINVFEEEVNQIYFESCLDLIWQCIRFESYFESIVYGVDNDLLPVSILRTYSSFGTESESATSNISDDEKKKITVHTQQMFEVHVTAAIKTGIHNSITHRLGFLHDEAEDKASFAYTFRHYDKELFGDTKNNSSSNHVNTAAEEKTESSSSGISIADHLDLCCIYAVHDVYKFIEALKKKHDTTFKSTFQEFFNVGNMHSMIADGLINPVIGFMNDFIDDIKCIIEKEQNHVMGYRQIKIVFNEMNEIYDYFLENCTPDSNPLLSIANMIHHSSHDNFSFYPDVNKQIIDYEKKNFHITNKTKQHQCWLKLKKRIILSPFNDYFINKFSDYFQMVERAIQADDFNNNSHLAEIKKFIPKSNKSKNNFILHSTSSTDVIYLLEKNAKMIIKNDLKPMQIVKLAEMITSILITYINSMSALARQEILNADITLQPVQRLSDNSTKGPKRFLSLNFNRRRSTVMKGRRLSSVLGIKTGNAIIKERLLVMIGNLSYLRTLFSALQNNFDLEHKYFEAINICNGAKEVQSALRSTAENIDEQKANSEKKYKRKLKPDNYQNKVYRNDLTLMKEITKERTMEISVMTEMKTSESGSLSPIVSLDVVRPMLKSKLFYDTIESTFEEIAQHLSDKLSTLVLNIIKNSVHDIGYNKNIEDNELFEGNPDETTMKSDILHNLYSILLSFDEIPKELHEFQYHLTRFFLSHFFLGIEQMILPTQSADILGINEILFLNNLLREFEGLLGDFEHLSKEALSNGQFYHYPELTRIHAIIVIYLTNTQEIIHTVMEMMRFEEKNNNNKEDGIEQGIINMDLIRTDEHYRKENHPYIGGHSLLLLIKYRAEKRKDAEAIKFMKKYKFKDEDGNTVIDLGWKQKIQTYLKKTSFTLEAVKRHSSRNILSVYSSPAVSFSLD